MNLKHLETTVVQSQRTITFGFYPEPLSFSTSKISVAPLPNLEEILAIFSTETADLVENGWIYAPIQSTRTSGAKVGKLAYVSRIFGLVKTHSLTHRSAESDEHLDFLVWSLSFFLGLRLTSTEMGFADATPIKRGKLVDFHLTEKSLPIAIELADAFWLANRAVSKRAKWFAAAIHALFLGQNPIHVQYENFLHLYMALEACYALARSLHPEIGRATHPQRIASMCEQFGLSTPRWALASGGTAEIPGLRNDTVHEALFMGEPLGFAIHGAHAGENVLLEMEALICRILVSLIGGAHVTYVTTPIDTRCLHGLDFT